MDVRILAAQIAAAGRRSRPPADDPAAGVEAGNRVIDHADQLNSQRVVDRIHNLRRDLTNHLHRSDVADFSQRLALVGAPGYQS